MTEITCEAEDCIFNKEGKCIANYIKIVDDRYETGICCSSHETPALGYTKNHYQKKG